MSRELIEALEELEKEKGIQKSVVIAAIEKSIAGTFGTADTGLRIRVEVEPNTGDIRAYATKTIVEEVTDPMKELSLSVARSYDPDFELGEEVEELVNIPNLGRIAAQNAKQVIVQALREAERNNAFGEYKFKERQLVSGTVQRIETRVNRDTGKTEKIIHLDLGKIEGILLPSEQIAGEQYRVSERIKVYVVQVAQKGSKSKDPFAKVSRSHPEFIRCLFENEIPEISEGLVEIVNIAREAGSRTKVAVYSNDVSIEPVGACVGQRGQRVRVIEQELGDERLEIIKWNASAADYIAASLSPAKVSSAYIDEENKQADVIVPDAQLSLAIGREGQNVRLAAKLTGWKIDIKSESQSKEEIDSLVAEAGIDVNAEVGEEAYQSQFGSDDQEQ